VSGWTPDEQAALAVLRGQIAADADRGRQPASRPAPRAERLLWRLAEDLADMLDDAELTWSEPERQALEHAVVTVLDMLDRRSSSRS
jgi:hypothetical protein